MEQQFYVDGITLRTDTILQATNTNRSNNNKYTKYDNDDDDISFKFKTGLTSYLLFLYRNHAKPFNYQCFIVSTQHNCKKSYLLQGFDQTLFFEQLNLVLLTKKI